MFKIETNQKCSCCSESTESIEPIESIETIDTVVLKATTSPITGDYICYCNKVTEDDIKGAILLKGATTVDEVIKITGAMVDSNCKVNNPKGICCYSDIVVVFNKYR